MKLARKRDAATDIWIIIFALTVALAAVVVAGARWLN
jgi:hypothetical protein